MPRPERRSPDVYEAGSRLDPFQILNAEHALLRLQVARAADAISRDPSGGEARRVLASISDSFRLHERREELVLYPECERLFGGPEGIASVLREDHDEMGQTLRRLLDDKASNQSVPSLLLEDLRSRMEDHFAKEERVLFPAMTAYLSGKDGASLSRRLRGTSLA